MTSIPFSFPRIAFICLALSAQVFFPSLVPASEWQRVAFPGCTARAVVFHPTHPETCYAGSQSCGAALEGIHRSASEGLSWLDLGTEEHSARSIAVDPKNPRRLVVVCPDAVYRSEDGGESWLLSMDGIDLVATAEFMTAVAMNPVFPDTVFATKRSTYGLDAVYRSTDHAQTWSELYVPVPGYYNPPYDIAIDPKSPGTVYVAMGSYLMVSQSNGDVGSWYSLLKDDAVTFRELDIDPVNTGRLYAAAQGEAPHGGVYRSLDGGAHWKLLGVSQGLTSTRITAVAVDPTCPQRVYAGTGNDLVRIYRSTDGGDSWSPFDAGLPTTCRINAIAVHPGDGSVLLTATSTDGLYRWGPATAVAANGIPGPVIQLEQNSPNPFHPSTEIRFSLPQESPVTLEVFNVRGQAVRTLVSGVLLPGEHQAVWDGRDDRGQSLAGGVYFLRLRAADVDATRRMVLLK